MVRRRLLRSDAIAALVLVASALAACSQSGSVRATASASPTRGSAAPLPALTQTFTSPLNAYSISYPAGWSVQPATKRWKYPRPGPENPAEGSDILRDPTRSGIAPGNPGWGISAMAIPAGMSDAEWLDWYIHLIGTSNSCNPPHSAYKPIVIDGHPAGVHGGWIGCNFTEAVVVADHVGYVFVATPNLDSGTDQVYPPALFDAMLHSVHLG
jgi:hypothetical protein